MASILAHTVRIKRLDLKVPAPAVQADADFSRLGHYSKEEKRVVNAENPFISDTICSKPFQETQFLRQGVHLHFILPQAISRFSSNPQEILPAPNRWLIKRITEQKEVDQSWVLESDFLSPKPLINGHVSTMLPIDPYASGHLVFKEETQPFRFMGRIISAKDYFADDNRKEGDYWGNLMQEEGIDRPFTAFAYGNLNFASFYPNCHSVFGFHDIQGTAEHQYEVYGWYEDSDQKEGPKYLNELLSFFEKMENTEERPEKLAEKWRDEYNLKQPSGIDLKQAEQLLFYGLAKCSGKPISTVGAKLALGNDMEETFSAFLAKRLSKSDKVPFNAKEIENLLEAIEFDMVGSADTDLKPKFEAKRHARTFKAHQGNTFLGIELYSKEKADTKEQRQKQLWQTEEVLDYGTESPFYQLRQDLEGVNDLLLQYEKAMAKVQSIQQLLHSHWQKYLQSAHPPLLMGHLLPDSNETLMFIKKQVIPALEAQMAITGRLESTPAGSDNKEGSDSVILQLAQEDHWKENSTIISSPWKYTGRAFAPCKSYKGSLASQIMEMLKQINGSIEKVNACRVIKKHKSIFCLKHELGQRFFEPSAPAILMASPAFQTFSNNESTQLRLASLVMLNDLEGSGSFSDVLKYCMSHSPKGLKDWEPCEEPVQPAYLDWELYFYPLDKVGVVKREYDPQFILERFELTQKSPEFKVKAGQKMAFTHGVSRYIGRAPVLANDGDMLKKKLEALLGEHGDDELVKKALETLNKFGYLVQELNGFNHAFSQQRNSLQLPIGDPIAFSDYKRIYKNLQIAEYIGDELLATPVADYDFNPVRAGAADLTRLNIIDSFGMRQQLVDSQEKPQLAVPETMTLPNAEGFTFRGRTEKRHAFFYPRFMQAVALRANWIATQSRVESEDGLTVLNHTNTNKNPISGWVVFNQISNALMIYERDGRHLCNLFLVGDRREMSPAPGLSYFKPKDASDAYLAAFIKYMLKLPDFRGFLDLLRNSLFGIDPDGHAGHHDLGFLFGRPLALVRMQLSFEVKGQLLCRKDHGTFRQMLRQSNPNPQTAGYEEVDIPLRIGDYRKLNDGVVLYWKDPVGSAEASSWGGCFEQETYCNSIDRKLMKGITEKNEQKDFKLKPFCTQSLSDEPQRFSMLLDPRGSVHISSGVVPMTVLHLPDRYWQKTIANLRYVLGLEPLIFPREELKLSLPEVNGYSWAWLQKTRKKSLQRTPQQLCIYREVFEENKQSNEEMKGIKWKELVTSKLLFPGVFGNKNYALVKLQNLTEEQKASGLTDIFLTFFEKYGTQIKAFNREISWEQNELHEGWAQLYPDTKED